MAKFKDMLKKAEKRGKAAPDYRLELSEDEIYHIPYPDALQMLEFSELEDSQTLSQLRVLFAKNHIAWNALVRHLDGEDASVLQVLTEDMFEHWNKHGVNPGKSSKRENSEK